jgi:hypothetical protein
MEIDELQGALGEWANIFNLKVARYCVQQPRYTEMRSKSLQ